MATIEMPNGIVRDVEIYRSLSGDWEALYLDGVLHSQGHSVLETFLGMIGLEPNISDAFLRGGNGGGTNKTAPTLGDLEQWVAERDSDLEQARLLRIEANEKIADAARLEARYRS